MNDAWIGVVATSVGVLVGGTATVSVEWIRMRAAANANRRERLHTLMDDLWEAHRTLRPRIFQARLNMAKVDESTLDLLRLAAESNDRQATLEEMQQTIGSARALEDIEDDIAELEAAMDESTQGLDRVRVDVDEHRTRLGEMESWLVETLSDMLTSLAKLTLEAETREVARATQSLRESLAEWAQALERHSEARMETVDLGSQDGALPDEGTASLDAANDAIERGMLEVAQSVKVELDS